MSLAADVACVGSFSSVVPCQVLFDSSLIPFPFWFSQLQCLLFFVYVLIQTCSIILLFYADIQC